MPNMLTQDAATRDRLRSIIERLPDGIVVVDRQGIIRFANPAAERLFGRPAAELVGSQFGFAVYAGETTEIDIVQRGGSGVIFAELRVVDTEWEGEQVELVSLRDVTDRKHAEERSRQLVREREARLEAEAANQAKSEFLAIMSHELRTPLNAVLGYSEILELGLSGPLTDQMRDQVGRIRMSGRHLLGLVNEILDLAKVESGKLTVQSAPASGADVVAAAVALTHPQAALRGLQLSTDGMPTDDALVFVGDEERVRQILVNLLSNAVKFTTPGGKITIHGETVETPDREARLVARRKYVAFRVTDTGMGIPAGKLSAIFDPFVQADSGPTREREGSGLGLTISRRLARLMGGDLTVRSTPGEGSTFTLWLPGDDESGDVMRRVERGAMPTGAGEQLSGICDAGAAILDNLPEMVAHVVERIQRDPNLTMAAGLRRFQVADHLASFLADTAVALLVTGAASGPTPLLADATEIQRLISERHGQQRARLGWTESALRREFMIVREEAERVVRTAVAHRPDGHSDDAVTLLHRFIDQAEYVASRSLLAAHDAV